MQLEKFKKIIDSIRESSDRTQQLYKLNVDLIGYDDKLYEAINIMFEDIYGTQGNEWIGWFCYENDYGRHDLQAFDGDNRICQTVEDLWEYIEQNHSQKTGSTYCSKCQSTKENCACKFIKQ